MIQNKNNFDRNGALIADHSHYQSQLLVKRTIGTGVIIGQLEIFRENFFIDDSRGQVPIGIVIPVVSLKVI